jgi:hypothetical protein
MPAIDHTTAALLLSDESRAYLILFTPWATGATVHAFSAASGVETWTVPVGGMTCAHSAYRNDVVAELDAGRLLVWGNESMGRYVAALDPASGRRWCQRVFDPGAGCE